MLFYSSNERIVLENASTMFANEMNENKSKKINVNGILNKNQR